MCVALGRRSNLPPVLCVALVAWVLWNVEGRTQELLQRGFLSGPNLRKILLNSLIIRIFKPSQKVTSIMKRFIIRTLTPSRGGKCYNEGGKYDQDEDNY